MKNILISTSAFPLRKDEGLNEFMLEYARELAADHRVYILAPRSANSLREEQWDNILIFRHRQFPLIDTELAYGSGIMNNIRKNPFLIAVIPFYFLYQFFALRRLVKKYNIHVINAHWIIPQGIVAAFYRRLKGKKVKLMLTSHGSDLLGLNFPGGNAMKKFTLKHSDLLSVVSARLKEVAVSLGYKQPIHILPMGINTGRFLPEASVEKNSGFSPVLLFVGNCVEDKGLPWLLEAAGMLKEKYPQILLEVIGEGRVREDLEKSGVPSWVRFAGSVQNKELPAYYNHSDVFILPSLSEGYSLVVREAMSCETPVVVTDLPVFTEDLQLKNLLHFTERRSARGIFTAVEKALDSKKTGNNASLRKYVEEHASWKHIGAQYRQLLEEI